MLLTVRRYLPAYHPAGERPRIDYLGAALFTGALVPILVGLTNKQAAEWTDPTVGGLIGLGFVILAVFVWVESRAAEPIVPLGLFRNRAFTVSVASAFLVSFGFFAAVVFLPRWFQVVGGVVRDDLRLPDAAAARRRDHQRRRRPARSSRGPAATGC